jgi:phosphate-selective porin OprO and OprP
MGPTYGTCAGRRWQGPKSVLSTAALSLGAWLLTAAAEAAEHAPRHRAEDVQALETEGAFGKGLQFHTEDDAFAATIRTRFQARATNVVHDSPDEEPSTDVMIRRMRLVVMGHAFEEAFTYYVQLGFSTLDVDPDAPSPVRDAYATWIAHRDVNVRFGQMKVPFDRQRVNSSSALQMPDRSIVTSELNLERDVGAQLLTRDLFGLGKRLGYNLGVFGGDGRNRVSGTYGLLYAGRIELTPLGAFEDAYIEADIARSRRPRLAVAIAGAYNQNSDRPRSTLGAPYSLGGFDYYNAGVDWAFKYSGLALTGAVLHRHAPRSMREGGGEGAPVQEHSRSASGFFVQGGQMLDPHLEVSARYGSLSPIQPTDPRLRRQRELGGAVSYYVLEHQLKIQLDHFYLFGDWGAGRHQTRLQIQLFL